MRSDLKIEHWPIDKVLPYARNSRLHSDAQVEAIVASIKEFGFVNPCLVDAEGVLIAGHGRVLALRKLGRDRVPIIKLGHLTGPQARALRIADNQLPLLASWSEEMLRTELTELSTAGFDMQLLGFEDAQLVQFMANLPSGADPEVIPPVPENAMSRIGDLWQLGKHRLLCGDSTKKESVRLLMKGERAVLFSTDPPFAVGYTGGTRPRGKGKRKSGNKNWEKVYQDVSSEKDGEALYDAFVKVALDEAISSNAAWYCWHSSNRAPMVERVWNNNGAFAHQQIIWKKSRSALTYSVYLWAHEPCLMGWIRGKKPRRLSVSGMEFNSTVWEVPNSEISDEHPTSKPTKLFSIPMLVHTVPGELCFEPFSGSGSQIIAAEKENRRCYAMEISPQFVDVAVQRWQEFAKAKATLAGDGRSFAEVTEARKKPRQRTSPLISRADNEREWTMRGYNDPSPDRRAVRRDQQKKNPLGWITVLVMLAIEATIEMLLNRDSM